jgi:hypothetical protein
MPSPRRPGEDPAPLSIPILEPAAGDDDPDLETLALQSNLRAFRPYEVPHLHLGFDTILLVDGDRRSLREGAVFILRGSIHPGRGVWLCQRVGRRFTLTNGQVSFVAAPKELEVLGEVVWVLRAPAHEIEAGPMEFLALRSHVGTLETAVRDLAGRVNDLNKELQDTNARIVFALRRLEGR